MKHKYLITIAIDGLKFHGTQSQPDKRTVQGELETHLSYLFNEEIKVKPSSRIDTYVHALRWPFTIEAENKRELHQVKSYLEDKIPDIRVSDMKEVDMDFHPQYDAVTRRYAYKIYTKEDSQALHLKNYHLEYSKPLDKTIIKSCLKMIKGEHDFASFTAREKYDSTIRKVTHAEFRPAKKDGYAYIIIEAEGFLRWMVRNLVGAILAVNDGRITMDQFIDLLENPQIGKAQWKAWPGGLYKVNTKYPKKKLRFKQV